MSDKLVFDLAQEYEGSPNVFVRKDWINILDNQNQNYNNNQSVIDTSQLSNSNKYMSYRESYFVIPLLLSLEQIGTPVTSVGGAAAVNFNPAVYNDPGIGAGTSIQAVDYSIGLKNWFGNIIHSFTMDYNGTTIIQQTPFSNMWNMFKLLTSLSYDDILLQGTRIGFFPDDATKFSFIQSQSTIPNLSQPLGQGVSNTSTAGTFLSLGTVAGPSTEGLGNLGYVKRLQTINFDTLPTSSIAAPYVSLITQNSTNLLWKSHILKKAITSSGVGLYQIGVTATVYLKHIHSFFNMCPLLKGVFMKMTMNLNNTTTTFAAGFQYNALSAANGGPSIVIQSVQNAIGGVSPQMISTTNAVPIAVNGATTQSFQVSGGLSLAYQPTAATANTNSAYVNYKYNISVGATCLDPSMTQSVASKSGMAASVYLYIPAYTFNPTFESAYLSTPRKKIRYTDIYQYQVLNVNGNGSTQINQLLTNGIANIKSVLVLPFYSTGNNNDTPSVTYTSFGDTTAPVIVNLSGNSGFLSGVPVYQSPFDPAGCGCTSPLCHITNFNIQVSGQNAIYNLQKYTFEEFNDQLYGENSINGGLTDGLCSGLIGREQFDMEYCFYYVNVERMLPAEKFVPKSIQLVGQNLSTKSCDYYCFVEYEVEIEIDALTGSRVTAGM